MKPTRLHEIFALSALFLATSTALAVSSSVGAAAADSDRGSVSSAVSGTSGTAEAHKSAQLAAEFESFAGSAENAQNLVTGLHNGHPITLAGGGNSGSAVAVSFRSPTPPLDFGDISHALHLARAHLEAQGLVKPTPDEVKLALVGGSITTVTDGGSETFASTGVLQLRSEGLGWGQIAHALSIHGSEEAANGYDDARAAARGAHAQLISSDAARADPDHIAHIVHIFHESASAGGGIQSDTAAALGGDISRRPLGAGSAADIGAGMRSGVGRMLGR